MKYLTPALAALMISFATSPAFAFDWHYYSENKALIGSTGEEEGDTDFRATCKDGGKAEIGIGAQENIGKGEGEAVSVMLASGSRSLTIDGTSGESPNFQMTGGVELQTMVDGGHAIFALLGDKGPIKVSGPIKTTWPDKGRAAATAAFVKACFGK
ncbi:MAG: hypothetical protein GC190_20795 [Alphaproteobacteria bacterium]|nr:hypothetical protein [Alphaproteobacteria bacterium]